VVQNGVIDAAVVETRLTAADGSTFDADVVFFDPSSRARVRVRVRVSLHDNTLNLPVVARQPHPDPNHASHTAARRVASAKRTSLGVS